MAFDPVGRILLLRRKDNELWALPGGVMQPGETIAAAAVREAKEETNIDVEITGLVGVYSDPRHVIAYANGEVRQEFNVAFEVVPCPGPSVAARNRWRCASSLQPNWTNWPYTRERGSA